MTINQSFNGWEVVTDEPDDHIRFRHLTSGNEVTLKDDGSMDVGGIDTRRIGGEEQVSSESDLPDPSGGTITLENKAYKFDGFITSPNSIDISNSPVFLASHGSLGGFIHTGGGDAIVGTDGAFFARDFFFSAPGGTMFNISGDTSTEMLVESVTFSDAANLGNISNLGTIDGFRVPSFKGCNFEDFDAGLTFSGTSEKIFFEGCPFRGVSASGVTILQGDSTLNTDILKISTDCYVKDVQSDTEVLRVDPGATINNYIKYFNVDHDDTVTRSNILEDVPGSEAVGTIVRNSFPLADSSVNGELTLDSQVTVTGSGAGAVAVDDGTWTLQLSERVSQPSAGLMQYNALYDTDVELEAFLTVIGSNTEFSMWIEQNGSQISRSRIGGSTSGSSKPASVETSTVVQDATSVTPDQFGIQLENTGGTSDLDAVTAKLQLLTR